jgi:hypothetical protein
VNADAPAWPFEREAEAAIARVLRAEREARAALEQTRLDVARLAEDARLVARAVAERTEQRIRAASVAFESDTAAQRAAIDAEAADLCAPQPLSTAQAARLQACVRALARERVGPAP